MNEDEIEVIKNIKLELEMTGDMPRLVFSRNDIECMLKLIEKQQEAIEYIQNPTICGRSYDEIVNILTGLDIEKQYKIDVTMENLKSFMAIYQKEVEDSLHNATTELISGISGTEARIEFQIPHYDFLKKEKGE